MPYAPEPLLVNMVGHTAGAVVFGIFLFLLVRGPAAQRGRDSRLSIATAALSFVWNLSSLAALALPAGAPSDLVAAVSFSTLSLLPAVLLHIALDREYPLIFGAGYALSGAAAVFHIAEYPFGEASFHRRALVLITIGFSILTVTAAAAIARGGQRRRLPRVIGTMGLALFAMSFVHFAPAASHNIWASELFIHHAGLPLALFVLLQDDRFVLVDAFVRFLANVLLSAVMTLAAFRLWVALEAAAPGAELWRTASLLAGISLLLILFAVLRTALQGWLTRKVFRHHDAAAALDEIRSGASGQTSEEVFVAWAAKKMAGFVDAVEVEVREASEPRPGWAETHVVLRVTRAAPRAIWLGRRKGGRRYLSEDFEFLDRVAAAIAERIEEFHAVRMEALVSQAELRALQSQINPHFLFNALNTLYGVIPRSAANARRMVQNLADMFRYSLQSEGAMVPVERELQIVEAYLDIEQLRMGERLRVVRSVDPAALFVAIPVFTIQPLVENAIKHAIARNPEGGVLTLTVAMQAGGDVVSVAVEDTGAGATDAATPGSGLGLANVRKRLVLSFGACASLTESFAPAGSRVECRVPATALARS